MAEVMDAIRTNTVDARRIPLEFAGQYAQIRNAMLAQQQAAQNAAQITATGQPPLQSQAAARKAQITAMMKRLGRKPNSLTQRLYGSAIALLKLLNSNSSRLTQDSRRSARFMPILIIKLLSTAAASRSLRALTY